MNTIDLQNVGPVEKFSYNLSEYGVHVLEGFNGCGKSTTLRAVQFITDGDTDMRPTKRDGSKRGTADVCGRTLRITESRSAFDGELQVEGLSNLSISDLHNPDFDKPVTRDAHRIKALTRIAQAKADIALFYDLLGGQVKFEAVIPRDSMSTTDLVKMSQMVKGAIEKESRRIEELAQSAKSDALAQQTIAGSVDHSLPHDDAILQRAHLAAVAAHATLKEKRKAYRATIKAADEAKGRLAAIQARVTAEGATPTKSISEATSDIETAQTLDNAAMSKIGNLEQQIRTLQQSLEVAKAERETTKRAVFATNDALGAAKNAVALRGELDAAIEAASGVTETTEEQVDDAAEAVGAAADAVSQGFAVRQAIAAESKAQEHLERAKTFSAESMRLREAASETADVLTRAIEKLPGCPLRIRFDDNGDARLVTATERSPETPFDQMSDGQKWLIVLKLAVAKNRLVVMPQSAFEGLSRKSQDELHRAAVAAQAYVLTAHVADCELRCSRYVEHSEAAE